MAALLPLFFKCRGLLEAFLKGTHNFHSRGTGIATEVTLFLIPQFCATATVLLKLPHDSAAREQETSRFHQFVKRAT